MKKQRTNPRRRTRGRISETLLLIVDGIRFLPILWAESAEHVDEE